MDYPGLLSWANSIRSTMASDPGRQVYKDQVHTHGFMFLEAYLDNIVSGEKADPLIELVKTPGRKKAIARKPKLISSKLVNNIISEENIVDKNLAPVSSFQVALEKVKTLNGVLETLKVPDNKSTSEKQAAEKDQRLPFTPLPPVADMFDASLDSPVNLISPALPTLEPLLPANMERNDLSIIAEDDEPSERSQASTSAKVPPTLPIQVHRYTKAPVHMSVVDHSIVPSQSGSSIASTSSAETFESIPLSPPEPRCEENSELHQMIVEPTEAANSETAKHIHESLPTKNLPNDTPDSFMSDTQEDTVLADRKSSERPAASSFPTLPGPMPLRKSMRAPRDPSLNTIMLGAATPGAAIGGKRTSWLAKAREVKALEAPAKKLTTSSLNSNSNAGQGTKRKSEDMLSIPPIVPADDERRPKTPKLVEGDTASRQFIPVQPDKPQEQQSSIDDRVSAQELSRHDDHVQQEGVLDRLKKTVEGLGVRVPKTTRKSIDGGAATALAEAKAAAEARIAERDRKEDEMTIATRLVPANVVSHQSPQDTDMKMSTALRNEARLSLFDFSPADGRMKEKPKFSERPFQFTPSLMPTSTKKDKENTTVHERTSTTSPHSPQSKSRPLPPAPVFNKPPPVFVPPSNTTSLFAHQPVFNRPPSSPKHTVPPSVALGFSPRASSPSSSKARVLIPLTAHSTLESVQSDIFDQDDVPAWVPSTQDTEYTSGYDSQSQPQNAQICDEDDSWPLDDKLAAGVQWTFGVSSKEDSMTWSTLPSQSQRGPDSGPIMRVSPIWEKRGVKISNNEANQQIPGAFYMDIDQKEDIDEPLEQHDTEPENMIMGSSKQAISVVEPKIPRSQSQLSMASSESSQSQVGFLGQASKIFSALGTSKKKQPEVKKVLQMAATAAKKQQEEADKKAARLKEMDNRRQLAQQRKAEEEKVKALEEERKIKEESERRKKEREDLTDKRSIKPSTSKRDEECNKKRKIDSEKKQELKKPGPSVLVGKAHLKTAPRQPSTMSLNTIFGFGLAQPPAVASASTEPSSSSQKGKGIAHQMLLDDDVSQPSQFVQSQMAARAKAQIAAAKPQIASESIELPDINSEYSDSEDEDRPRTFDPPDWAQSPELRQALEMQSTINPDNIFGAVRPIKMEEIFKTRTSRFRPRSSSANWTGTDRLTLQEEKDYARRMGFR